MVEPYKPLYTVKEVAKILRVSPGSVYELLNTGKLPHLKLGEKKIRGTDLERFIEAYPSVKVGEGQAIETRDHDSSHQHTC